MLHLDENKLQIIASYLITFKNLKANFNLKKSNITYRDLHRLSGVLLGSLGFLPEEIKDIKSNNIKIAEKEIDRVSKNGFEIIFKGEDFYPALLSEIYDPPPFIYVMGDKDILNTEKIAVVGSRRASSYGFSSLNNILPDVSRNGITVVSGMAYGIDSMAHRIAVRENGKTIGVNAGGLLHPYPAGNRSLIDRILKNGCIITEFPLDVTPRPFFFLVRNRIIAGISRSILIVEAAFKSGSLITAKLGLEQNRDIFAIPGRIDSPLSQGTNYLIQQGAKIITSSQDILIEYGIILKKRKKAEKLNISKKEKKILDLMTDNELKSIDYFVDKLDFSVSEIISLLMGMVLKNIVTEEAGGYRRIK